MSDEKEEATVSDSQLSAEVSAREVEVNAFLLKKNKVMALQAALRNPPMTAKSSDIKDANAAILEKVLASVVDSEISGLVESLDLELCDNLMKYVYRFMGKSTNCPLMLKLHSQLVEKAGQGSIVRALTDRKQV